jgi:hypothetical protein
MNKKANRCNTIRKEAKAGFAQADWPGNSVGAKRPSRRRSFGRGRPCAIPVEIEVG